MERLRSLYSHELWLENFRQLQETEQDRVFCRHTLEHFLDVARIAYIENLEKGLGIPKVHVYAAALLHDIGRAAQYRDGTPHEQAGQAISREILRESGFSAAEQNAILSAIAGHRDPGTKTREDLAGILYRADKASRMCLFCNAKNECNWDDQKKNLTIII